LHFEGPGLGFAWAASAPAPGHATPEATEPLPTIFQALDRQGLKLTPKKVMADYLVIDHIESPTGN
jgi:uncharacterized protein (TIGR03435 family)